MWVYLTDWYWESCETVTWFRKPPILPRWRKERMCCHSRGGKAWMRPTTNIPSTKAELSQFRSSTSRASASTTLNCPKYWRMAYNTVPEAAPSCWRKWSCPTMWRIVPSLRKLSNTRTVMLTTAPVLSFWYRKASSCLFLMPYVIWRKFPLSARKIRTTTGWFPQRSMMCL